MHLVIAAVGRLKKGPETELVSRYHDRLVKSGKSIGISSLKTFEIPESRLGDAKARKAQEHRELVGKLPHNTITIAFDERGKSPGSREFSRLVQNILDDGTDTLALLIGGPDGLDSDLRSAADHVISFGSLTFPHQIVRILVLEQLYRAVTIATNHPYHRE